MRIGREAGRRWCTADGRGERCSGSRRTVPPSSAEKISIFITVRCDVSDLVAASVSPLVYPRIRHGGCCCRKPSSLAKRRGTKSSKHLCAACVHTTFSCFFTKYLERACVCGVDEHNLHGTFHACRLLHHSLRPMGIAKYVLKSSKRNRCAFRHREMDREKKQAPG